MVSFPRLFYMFSYMEQSNSIGIDFYFVETSEHIAYHN